MVDYYAILAKAMNAPEAADAGWRRDIYARARQMLVARLQGRRSPATPAEIRTERAALDAAIARLESELSRDGFGAGARDDIAERTYVAPQRGPIAKPLQLSSTTWVAVACAAAAVIAAGYVYWIQHARKVAPSKAVASQQRAAPTPAAPAAPVVATTKDGDLPPGVDGTADADLAYVFRRQSTFYRTLLPPGTVIVDKLQHFLYLIQPNNVAVRYGIGVGEDCVDLAGLRRIAGKAEWPAWEATQDMIKRRLAKPGTLPGGPGNPLGARALELDDHASRINGTNAPKTIGTSVVFGCIRMVNDDVADLYNRVQVGTSVVVN